MSRVLVASVVALAVASPDCKTFDECHDCTEASTWTGLGYNCRWCPTNGGGCHAIGSLFNPCSKSENIYDTDQCPALSTTFLTTLAPTPPRTKGELQQIMEKLFSVLKITDIDVDSCVQDESGAFQALKDFGGDFKSAQYLPAVKDLARAISAASNAVGSCGLPEVQQKLDVLASSIQWANISTDALDNTVTILVGASDLWKDLEALAESVSGGDYTDMGSKLAFLLTDWTAITGGCGASNKACKLIDGLLRALSVVGLQVDGCESALSPAITDLQSGVVAFKAKNYTHAAQEFATSLDVIALALQGDSCGLKPIGDAISRLSPRLAAAIAQVDSSGAVQIIVGSADVYNELYGAVMDFERDDLAGVGIHMGALLKKLRSSGCQTQICSVLEGILGSMQLAFTDFEECSADFEDTWTGMQTFLAEAEAKQWQPALASLGDVFGDFSKSVSGCGVGQLATILEETATRLKQDSAAAIIGEVAQVLISGADVTDDLHKIIVDAQAQDWVALGRDLGSLSDWVGGTGCNTFVCRLIEGILQQADMSLVNLGPCKDSLRSSETEFAQGASLWKQGKNGQALQLWAAGLNDIAKSVDTCGVAPELAFIQHEAQVLGLGNLAVLDNVAQVIVHGADFYEELFAAATAMENKDYRSAGQYVGKVMSQMSEWTTGHLCTNPICYVVNGVLQYLAAMQNDIGSCKSDFGRAFGNFTEAYHLLVDKSVNRGGVDGDAIQFGSKASDIKKGVQDLGFAIKNIAAGVEDCHLTELANILEQLAVKLDLVPEIQWVETLLKIVIEGHEIELEVSNVCSDYATDNYPALGYDLVKLTKTLLAVSEEPRLKLLV